MASAVAGKGASGGGAAAASDAAMGTDDAAAAGAGGGPASHGHAGADAEERVPFARLNLGLDARVTKAVAKLGFIYPTLVQAKAVPLALAGRDLLVRAKTGSGKTLAYCLPLIHKILEAKSRAGSRGAAGGARGVRAVVLVPTRELCDQTRAAIADLLYYARDVVSVVALSSSTAAEQAAALRELPDIVVGTPGRVAAHVRDGTLTLNKTLETLVVDEADLVLSFGCGDDVRAIVKACPKICQGFLLSATFSSALQELQSVVLQKPAILKLQEDTTSGRLSQFYVRVPSEDKYLLLYALVRLNLIAGKALFFVNSISECFRLKLFLEQFSIRAAVLNAELPANSRKHILEQFNKGVFDYLVATDDSVGAGGGDVGKAGEANESDAESGSGGGSDTDSGSDSDSDSGSESGSDSEAESGSGSDEGSDGGDAGAGGGSGGAAAGSKRKRGRAKDAPPKQRARKTLRDADYGVARGIDFKDVGTVVNVDFPKSVASYAHRVGRTARAGASGAALSFVELQRSGSHYVESKEEGAVLDAVQKAYGPDDSGARQPNLLPFNLAEVEGFRYRVSSALSSVTRGAIKEARMVELKQEMVNSERLQAHFEDNPRDLAVLRHDLALRPKSVSAHLGNVPDYLLPESVTRAAATAAATAGIDGSAPSGKSGGRKRGARGGSGIRAADPLQHFTLGAVPSSSKGSRTMSGRNLWKMRRKKGKFGKKYKARGKPKPF